ncbi:unnamed protein product [Sympodiomycopsis kandeliae]
MSKSKSLPPILKSLVKQPLYPAAKNLQYPAGRSANPIASPPIDKLTNAFANLQKQAEGKGIGWGEWLSIATATIITLNSPTSLASLHRYAVTSSESRSLVQRLDRAQLMREVGLKCIGFIGIPKVINNLAALRKAVDEDEELSKALPTEPRRKLTGADIDSVQKAAKDMWDDIYQPHHDKLIKILGHSNPDLPVFILDGEYGPLFSPPHTFKKTAEIPTWEVNRLRTSLIAISALRAQGGVGPQVTSHVWGLMKAESSIDPNDPNAQGLKWLTSEEGAVWTVESVNELSSVVEGEAQQERPDRESKL